jgi:site-specific recombinase XerD
MDLSQAAEEFLAYLQHEKGCSDLTVIAYRSDFRQFLESLQSQGIPASIGNVTTAVARGYVTALSKAGLMSDN